MPTVSIMTAVTRPQLFTKGKSEIDRCCTDCRDVRDHFCAASHASERFCQDVLQDVLAKTAGNRTGRLSFFYDERHGIFDLWAETALRLQVLVKSYVDSGGVYAGVGGVMPVLTPTT